MKTWKLVSGILSMLLFVFVAFQSCVAGIGNTLFDNGDVSGSAGIIVAILLLSGGIVSVATRNGGKGGDIALIILYGIGGFLGVTLAGELYADLRIWGIWCLICLIFAMADLLIKCNVIKSNSEYKSNNLNQMNKKNDLPQYCISCGKELKNGWENCPYCGAEIKGNNEQVMPAEEGVKRELNPMLCIIIGVILVVIVLLPLAIKFINNEKPSDEEVIQEKQITLNRIELKDVDLNKYAQENIQNLLDADLGIVEIEGGYKDSDNTVMIMTNETGKIIYMEISGDETISPSFAGIRLGDDMNVAIKKAQMLSDYNKQDMEKDLGRAAFYNNEGDVVFLRFSSDNQVVTDIVYMFDLDIIEEFAESENEEDIQDNGQGLEDESGDSIVTIYDVDYIFPDSDNRLLTNEEIVSVDNCVRQMAINEIYARHGRRFNTAEIQDYFNSKVWYEGTIDPSNFNESVLNQYELANVKAIANSMGNVAVDNPITRYNELMGCESPYYF